MNHDDQAPMRLRWARMRFSIISHLLVSPPEPGELAGRLAELAAKSWRHPTKGSVIRLSPKTIERMYYAARSADDPLAALARKIPKHAGTHPGRRRSRVSIAITPAGPGSSITTTSSRSRRPMSRSPRCRATRRCAAS
jgi:hypothetical protein